MAIIEMESEPEKDMSSSLPVAVPKGMLALCFQEACWQQF